MSVEHTTMDLCRRFCEAAFCIACANGHFELAQRLLSMKPDIDILADDEFALFNAAENGHFEVVQWLLSMKPDMDIQILNELFIAICRSGHLEMVIWLLSMKPDIDILYDNVCSFRVACLKGHLEVARWLLSIQPDIDLVILNDEDLKWVCLNGHFEIVQWLVSMKPNIFQDLIWQILPKCNEEIQNLLKSLLSVQPKSSYPFETVEKNDECAICLGLSLEMVTSCGHQYCYDCISESMKRDCRCPCCRQNFILFQIEVQESVEDQDYC